MKALNPNTGTYDTIYVKALDSMPVGTIVGFDGQASDIPTGWETYGTGQIKKTSETRPLTRSVVNEYSESTENAYSCDYVNKAEEYSTSEEKTNKIFKGKPVYRKVVDYTLTATTGFPTFSTGIQNAEDVFIFIEKQYGTDNSQYVSGITSYNGYFTKSNGNFSFNLGNTDATKADPGQYTFIFEYTKTTD